MGLSLKGQTWYFRGKQYDVYKFTACIYSYNQTKRLHEFKLKTNLTLQISRSFTFLVLSTLFLQQVVDK